MTVDIRHGRCGRVFVTLHGSLDTEVVDRVHELLAAVDPTKPVIIDLESIGTVDPLALAMLAGEVNVPRRRLTISGLSRKHRRLLSDFVLQPPN